MKTCRIERDKKSAGLFIIIDGGNDADCAFPIMEDEIPLIKQACEKWEQENNPLYKGFP